MERVLGGFFAPVPRPGGELCTELARTIPLTHDDPSQVGCLSVANSPHHFKVMSTLSAPGATPSARSGLVYGLSAYIIWGGFPLYFHLVAHVPPLIVLCHRIVWSVLFLALVVSARREWKPIGRVMRHRRTLGLLSLGAILIALNWLLFIYAVGSGQTLQASLGYFINPLLSVALGMVFLGERLRRWQWVAAAVATAAVANMAFRGGGFPWLAVSLALSFGFYGLVRKKLDINSLHGLLVETVVLFPAAAAIMAFWPGRATSPGTFGILSLAGVLTAVPLLLFGVALRRLPLSAIGFLQYINPTLQFLVAVLLFHEPLDRGKLGSFGLCWLAIVIYAADSLLGHRPQAVSDDPE
jgi:chloramphenicol-sensitive protein RarD